MWGRVSVLRAQHPLAAQICPSAALLAMASLGYGHRANPDFPRPRIHVSSTESAQDLLDLAVQFLTECNSLFAAAQRCEDWPLATQVARAALGVAIDSVIALNYSAGRKLANTWFDRLQLLFINSPIKDPTIEKTLKWAEIAIARASPIGHVSTETSEDVDE